MLKSYTGDTLGGYAIYCNEGRFYIDDNGLEKGSNINRISKTTSEIVSICPSLSGVYTYTESFKPNARPVSSVDELVGEYATVNNDDSLTFDIDSLTEMINKIISNHTQAQPPNISEALEELQVAINYNDQHDIEKSYIHNDVVSIEVGIVLHKIKSLLTKGVGGGE